MFVCVCVCVCLRALLLIVLEMISHSKKKKKEKKKQPGCHKANPQTRGFAASGSEIFPLALSSFLAASLHPASSPRSWTLRFPLHAPSLNSYQCYNSPAFDSKALLCTYLPHSTCEGEDVACSDVQAVLHHYGAPKLLFFSSATPKRLAWWTSYWWCLSL